MKNKIQGASLLLLATIIWGSSFVSQSIAMTHMGPFTFQSIRCTLAVLALIPVIAVSDRFHGGKFFAKWKDRGLWKAGILCGIPLFFAINLQQLGLVDVDPGKSAFLTTMYIVMVPILGIFRRKKPSKMILISVVLAVVGLYFLSCVGVTNIETGDLLLLGCALMFAVQITFVDKYAQSVDALRLNTIQAFICVILSTIVMLFTEAPAWDGINACWLPLVHVGVLSMGVSYSLQIIGQKKLEPSTASLIMSMESVFAVFFNWIITGTVLNTNETIGCVLVLFAVLLSQIEPKKRHTWVSIP